METSFILQGATIPFSRHIHIPILDKQRGNKEKNQNQNIGWCTRTTTQTLQAGLTVLPIFAFIIAVKLSCNILKLDFGRYLTFAIINVVVSSLSLSPVLSLLVFGRLLLPIDILGERFTLAYFFFKLPILYDRAPAYLLVCALTIFTIYLCNILAGTYLTSRLLAFRFKPSLIFSYLVMVLSFMVLSLSIAVVRGIVAS